MNVFDDFKPLTKRQENALWESRQPQQTISIPESVWISLVLERDQLKSRCSKLKVALEYIEEQEKRGYISFCGVSYTRKVISEALENA